MEKLEKLVKAAVWGLISVVREFVEGSDSYVVLYYFGGRCWIEHVYLMHPFGDN